MVSQMRYSESYFIVGILILVLALQNNAYSQNASISDHVVINEVDVDPKGDDSSTPMQWVELYNPTGSAVSLGGWNIGATTGLKNNFTIPSGVVLQSQQFLVYTYGPKWFPHIGAVVQLRSADGTVIDQTPPLSDQQDDSNSWQRIYDGYSTGSTSDWVFKMATLGTTNGKMTTTTTSSQLTMSISTDKPNYIFGDMAKISGQVSQLVTLPGGGYIPQSVSITVSGPNGFQKTFTLFPGTNLQFSTYLKIDEVQGMTEGNYKVSASYGDATTLSSFSVGSVAYTPPPAAAAQTISISTDKSTYALSEPIILSGTVSQVIPLTPVSYKVYDPTNSLIYSGTIFPDTTGSFITSNPYQRSVATSGIIVNSVNPIYGTYRITAVYGSATASTTFTLTQTITQSAAVTISTDKQVYAPGETVIISGKTSASGLQNVGLSPKLQIVQTFSSDISSNCGFKCGGVPVNTVNIVTFVNVNTDNTFTYKLPLSGTSSGLGTYRITVTVPTGTATASFVVVTDPFTYTGTVSNAPFSIFTDKNTYAIGDPITISGQISNPISVSTQNAGAGVLVSILNSTGQPVLSQGSFINNIFVPTSSALTYSAYPDSNGAFQIKQIIQRGIFHAGTYTLKAKYAELTTSTTFTVYDTLLSGNQPIVANTDKNVYGLGETVNLNGKIASSATSSSYTVYLTKPDGTMIQNSLSVQNGQFSWSWAIPSSYSVPNTARNCAELRCLPALNGPFGIYKITISSNAATIDLYFEVSKNPQTDTFTPFILQTDKSQYQTTELLQLSGQIIPSSDPATKETNPMPVVIIYSSKGQEVYRTFVNVNSGGQFLTAIHLNPGVFKTDQYKAYGQYLNTRATTTFKVTDPFTTSSSKLALFITTDKQDYLPGETVLMTGRISYIISVDNVDLTIGLANDTVVREGEVISKSGKLLSHATVPFDQTSSFSYDYTIPKTASLGNYTISAQVPFGVFNAYYNVVSSLPEQNVTSGQNVTTSAPTNETTSKQLPTIIPENVGPQQKPQTASTIVEKTGKISDTSISIPLVHKAIGNQTFYPRELDGLLRLNPGDSYNVSLRVSSSDGTCVIGTDQTCKVIGSTITTSSSYQIVKINDTNYLVGYSGVGTRVQQFSIIPANADDVIPDGKWNIQITKNNQVSRFYYQATYISK
jgi:hypothetical protein